MPRCGHAGAGSGRPIARRPWRARSGRRRWWRPRRARSCRVVSCRPQRRAAASGERRGSALRAAAARHTLMSATTAREPCLSEVMTAMGFWDVIEVDALPSRVRKCPRCAAGVSRLLSGEREADASHPTSFSTSRGFFGRTKPPLKEQDQVPLKKGRAFLRVASQQHAAMGNAAKKATPLQDNYSTYPEDAPHQRELHPVLEARRRLRARVRG
jgi:hypothetical protein